MSENLSAIRERARERADRTGKPVDIYHRDHVGYVLCKGGEKVKTHKTIITGKKVTANGEEDVKSAIQVAKLVETIQPTPKPAAAEKSQQKRHKAA